MYKVGDKVQIKNNLVGGEDYGNVYFSDEMNIYAGKTFVIESTEENESFTCYTLDCASTWDWSEEMFIGMEKAKVTENAKIEMTFPEMAQKLIDGKFEIGAELIAKDIQGDNTSFYVGNNVFGYGITYKKDEWVNNSATHASNFNATWTVKEQPIKEMSIEEIQKELGYKLKIVEYSNQGVE